MNNYLRAAVDFGAGITTQLRALKGRRDGNVAIIFGLAAIPVIIGAGMAMDTARAYMVKIRLGAALDAAALAVGSQSAQGSSILTTDLKNYFYNNYCKVVPSGPSVTSCSSTVAGETNISVQANTDITGATVTYQASATMPTTFMQLVGVNSIPLTVTTQTTKFPGMEIAVVLDNTGSMLCGPNDGAPSYTDAQCAANVVSSDTSCTDSSNQSRICTLIAAANQFVTTLQGAITGPQSVYMAIVPYVTTVNIGDSLCSNNTTCSNIAGSGSGFTDLRGNRMPVTPITGSTASGSTTVSGMSSADTAATQPGMAIYGHGVPSGTTVSSVSGSSITISANATLTFSSNSLAVGPTSGNTSTPFTDPTTFTTTGTWQTTSKTVTVASTSGIAVGMVVRSGSSGIPASPSTTVSSIGSGTVTLSVFPTANQTNKSLTFSLAGKTTSGSTTVTNLVGTTTNLNSIVVGMAISGTGIPANAYVTSINTPTKQLTLSTAATTTSIGDIITLTNLGATTTTASNTISNVSFTTPPSVGQIIIGNGIPTNTTITAAPSTSAQYAAGTGSLTISNYATTPSQFSAATGTCCNTTLVTFAPLTYDSAYNSASPVGSSTTAKWGGCVVEATSSGENVSGNGALATSGNPDTSEPVSGTTFYPSWWASYTGNSWTTPASQAQTNEVQGAVVAHYDQNPGPNQGCPVSILPLTDLTTSAGQTAITNKINSMWPRDAAGTQVHVGAIWGWRVLSPNGPFASNNGHPLDYATANAQGWKKIIVLMTDGTEEWPTSTDYTGLGALQDGKIGTSSSTSTAQTNLGTRLSTLCTNLKASAGNVLIYTIGLGSDGAGNTTLQNCAGNGGFFEAATPSNLKTVFQDIANSIIHLRLTI